ncbi:MAG: hypothetical protein ABI678_29970 [Kofleriaceae bacterium]
MSYMDFSSWPRDQEQTFVVYEQRANESSKKAITIALVSAIGVLVLALGIYAGVEPEKKDMTHGMNMSNLTKKSKRTSADETPPPKQEAPKPVEAPATPPPAK